MRIFSRYIIQQQSTNSPIFPVISLAIIFHSFIVRIGPVLKIPPHWPRNSTSQPLSLHPGARSPLRPQGPPYYRLWNLCCSSISMMLALPNASDFRFQNNPTMIYSRNPRNASDCSFAPTANFVNFFSIILTLSRLVNLREFSTRAGEKNSIDTFFKLTFYQINCSRKISLGTQRY